MTQETYYLLDLGRSAPEDFASEATPYKATSPHRAAEGWAEFSWDDYHDGMSGDCLVADNPQGKGAQQFTVRCRVEVTFRAKEASRG